MTAKTNTPATTTTLTVKAKSIFPRLLCSFCEFCLDPFRRERDLAQPHTGRIEDGIPNSRSSDRYRRFAGAGSPGFRPINEDSLDGRNIRADAQRPIGSPIDGRDLLIVPSHFLIQRAAQTMQGAAFQLILQPIRI